MLSRWPTLPSETARTSNAGRQREAAALVIPSVPDRVRRGSELQAFRNFFIPRQIQFLTLQIAIV